MKTKIETNRENFLHKQEFLDKHEDCPTCKQKIGEEFKISESCAIDQKVAEIDKGIAEIDTEIAEITEALKEFVTVRGVIHQCQKELGVLANEKRNLEDRVRIKTKEITDIEAGSGILETLQNDMIAVEIVIEALTKEHKKLIEDKTVLTTAGDLLKDGGIKTKIQKQYIPIINQTVNRYLKELGFLAKFEIDEMFRETIKSRFRDEFSYGRFSQGEKMRIDLSLMLTWRAIAKARNSSSTNILILDETFDGSLDETGIDDFVEIMQSLSADTNVFVISHKQEQMIDKFSRVYKVEKKTNYTTLTELN